MNYVLRALRIDGGRHEVVLAFDPQSVKTTETVAYVSMALLIVIILLALGLALKKKK